MIRVGIIGYGYWGINLLRNFINAADCTVTAVCDARTERLKAAQKVHNSLTVFTDVDMFMSQAPVDAVVIATPVFLHFSLAKKALLAGKHVLVEKPLTASVSEAHELVELSLKHNLVLAVDHTFLFTGSVQKIKTCVELGGTITGEHGVGIEKINSMCVQFGEAERNMFWSVKASFDPEKLLNPDKAIPTLNRCAEYGRMRITGGALPHPELERF